MSTRLQFLRAASAVAVGGTATSALAAAPAGKPLNQLVERTAATLHVRMQLPDGWIDNVKLFPGMSYPIEVLSVTNKPVGFGQLGLIPNFRDLDPDGVQITLLEFPYVPDFDAPPGPTLATIGRERMTEGFDESESGFRVLQGWWRGPRAGLQVYAWIGSQAGDDGASVPAVLNGLRVI